MSTRIGRQDWALICEALDNATTAAWDQEQLDRENGRPSAQARRKAARLEQLADEARRRARKPH